MVALLISQNLFFFGYHMSYLVLSITIEFRVSDTVQEFKMFNKSLFLHLPCVINHMEAL